MILKWIKIKISQKVYLKQTKKGTLVKNKIRMIETEERLQNSPPMALNRNVPPSSTEQSPNSQQQTTTALHKTPFAIHELLGTYFCWIKLIFMCFIYEERCSIIPFYVRLLVCSLRILNRLSSLFYGSFF